MFSHMMIGTNDLERPRRSTTRCLARWVSGRQRWTATVFSTYQDRRLLGVEADQRRAGDARQWRHHRLCGRLSRAGRRLARGRHRQWRKDLRESAGIREGSAGKMYLAYLRDLDGNKICAMHRMRVDVDRRVG